MSKFSLCELCQSPKGSSISSPGLSFVATLRSKLMSTSTGDDDGHGDDETFNNVRQLFQSASMALRSEEAYYSIDDSRQAQHQESETMAACHWIPGRIEVMGKHTDYAGGNSLVCATSGRGMAMVSTMREKTQPGLRPNCGDSGGDRGNHDVTITIVSVLPPGMEAKRQYQNQSSDPLEERSHEISSSNSTKEASFFQVDRQLTIRHEIHLASGPAQNSMENVDTNPMENVDTNPMENVDKNSGENHSTSQAASPKRVDWTIYPTAVIHRLDQNFGLYPHTDDATQDIADNDVIYNHNRHIHVTIAISSNLPPASGLSTSSAIVVGLFCVLDSHFHLSSTEAFRNAIGHIAANDISFPVGYDNGGDNIMNTMCNLSTYLGNVENGRDYVLSQPHWLQQQTCLRRSQQDVIQEQPQIYNQHGTTSDGTVNETTSDVTHIPKQNIILKGTIQGGVGTFGGSEDHAAILMGYHNRFNLLSFCPTRFMLPPSAAILRPIVELSKEVTFVIAYSGAKANKAGDEQGDTDASIGYNNASHLASVALRAYLLGDEDGTDDNIGNRYYKNDGGCDNARPIIGTLADAIRWERYNLGVSPPDPVTWANHDLDCHDDAVKSTLCQKIRRGTPLLLSQNNLNDDDQIKMMKMMTKEEQIRVLVERFTQFYIESECLVPAAAYALSMHDYDMLGGIVDASHQYAVEILRNQTEETAWLPLWARGLERPTIYDKGENLEQPQRRRITALASSAFGAGFGGSCWALVYRHEAHEFARQWRRAYDERFCLDDHVLLSGDEDSRRHREFFVTHPGPGVFCV